LNTIKGECSVELLRENEDGSADFQFNFPQEALDALTRLGILTAIKAGIEDAKRLKPDDPVNTSEERVEFTDEIKRIAEEAGFVTWNGERWNIDGNVVDWANPYDDELVKFYHLVHKQAIQAAIDTLMFHHEQMKHRHNYMQWAATTLRLEYLEEDDNEQNQTTAK
jgi:HD-like signal output (HDOD) protein